MIRMCILIILLPAQQRSQPKTLGSPNRTAEVGTHLWLIIRRLGGMGGTPSRFGTEGQHLGTAARRWTRDGEAVFRGTWRIYLHLLGWKKHICIYIYIVGGFSPTHLKNMFVKLEIFPQRLVKIQKYIWNHHLDIVNCKCRVFRVFFSVVFTRFWILDHVTAQNIKMRGFFASTTSSWICVVMMDGACFFSLTPTKNCHTLKKETLQCICQKDSCIVFCS